MLVAATLIFIQTHIFETKKIKALNNNLKN